MCHSSPNRPLWPKWLLLSWLAPEWVSLVVILAAGGLSLAVLTPFDYQLTLFLSTHDLEPFADFFNRSLFNGDSQPGAGDFLYPLLLVAVVLYLPSWLWKDAYVITRGRLQAALLFLRPLTGFVLTSAFCSALLFVHTVKQVVGRARPGDVFEGKMAFSAWHQNGSHFFVHGSYTGSLPSGHTATASISLIFVYVLLALLEKRYRRVGWSALVLAVLFTISMGISRMMSASHWLTDVALTLFAEWALIHIFFFWILKVPQQMDYLELHGRPQPRRTMFELRFCFHLLLACFGIWAFFTGLRSYGFEGWSWLLALGPAGLLLTVCFLRMAKKSLAVEPL